MQNINKRNVDENSARLAVATKEEGLFCFRGTKVVVDPELTPLYQGYEGISCGL